MSSSNPVHDHVLKTWQNRPGNAAAAFWGVVTTRSLHTFAGWRPPPQQSYRRGNAPTSATPIHMLAFRFQLTQNVFAVSKGSFHAKTNLCYKLNPTAITACNSAFTFHIAINIAFLKNKNKKIHLFHPSCYWMEAGKKYLPRAVGPNRKYNEYTVFYIYVRSTAKADLSEKRDIFPQ